MADFEGLINQALAKQNAADPAIRERIYQSSRKALVKMLEKTGNLSDDVMQVHFGRLETSIAKIENRYAPPLEPEPVMETPVSASQLQPAQVPEPELEPEIEPEPDFTTPLAERSAKVLLEPVAQQPIQAPEHVTAPDVSHTIDRVFPADDPQVLPDAKSSEEFSAQQTLPSPSPEAGNLEKPISQKSEELDIIAELEALIPKSYQPAPLFPPVEVPKPNNQAAREVAPTQPAQPLNPEPARPTAPNTQEPSAQVPNAQAQNSLGQSASKTPQEASVKPPEQPKVEDFDTISSEPVEAFLGDVTQEKYTQDPVEDFTAERDEVRVYKRKNPFLRRIWPIFLALAVVLVILWILYALFVNMPAEDAISKGSVQPGAVGETQQGEDGNIYITLLEPTDLSALVTAGRGAAELISERNRQMLRLQSVRQGALTGSNAEPILLEMEKGVLKQISGKEVTVEIYAQSGQSGAAQFAVECDFAGDSICGRKRFRVGAQPQRIVFALDLKDGIASDARAYLAINTDITNAADASGAGDAINIIYVRLRLPNPNS